MSELLQSVQSCISDVKAWASVNMLKLNDDKTELMPVASEKSKHLHSLPTSITICNAQIAFRQSVKNLGFTLDCHLTMNAHISNIVRKCYLELHRLASIRRFLTITATATLVCAFDLSIIDYCSSLLFGSANDVTLLVTDTERCSSSNLAPSKVVLFNHTFKITSLAYCQSMKHLQNSLFVLPLSQKYCSIICH